MDEAMLSGRQQRERDYHRDHAALHADLAQSPVATDVIESVERRPWNAYWSMYDRIIAADLAGKHVLLPGCGFGEDAIRLALLGAKVSAFDISEDSVAIARLRAANAGAKGIDFAVMPSEALTYPDRFFDAVVFVDILHHVDIAATIAEVCRVLKSGGRVIGDELYTHSRLQRIRDSRLVSGPVYRVMQKYIYGGERPYITEDEHKIDEHEFAMVHAAMRDADVQYFGAFEGRLFPTSMGWASRIDHAITGRLGSVAAVMGSRVVFSGIVAP